MFISFSEDLYGRTHVISKHDSAFVSFKRSSSDVNDLSSRFEIFLPLVLLASLETELLRHLSKLRRVLTYQLMASINNLACLHSVEVVFISDHMLVRRLLEQ